MRSNRPQLVLDTLPTDGGTTNDIRFVQQSSLGWESETLGQGSRPSQQVDGSGKTWVMWSDLKAKSIVSVTRTANSAWSAPRAIVETPAAGSLFFSRSFSLDPSGEPVLCFYQSMDKTYPVLKVARHSPLGWSTETVPKVSDEYQTGPCAVVVSPTGTLWVLHNTVRWLSDTGDVWMSRKEAGVWKHLPVLRNEVYASALEIDLDTASVPFFWISGKPYIRGVYSKDRVWFGTQ